MVSISSSAYAAPSVRASASRPSVPNRAADLHARIAEETVRLAKLVDRQFGPALEGFRGRMPHPNWTSAASTAVLEHQGRGKQGQAGEYLAWGYLVEGRFWKTVRRRPSLRCLREDGKTVPCNIANAPAARNAVSREADTSARCGVVQVVQLAPLAADTGAVRLLIRPVA